MNETSKFFVSWWYSSGTRADQGKGQLVRPSGGAGPEMVRILVRAVLGDSGDRMDERAPWGRWTRD